MSNEHDSIFDQFTIDPAFERPVVFWHGRKTPRPGDIGKDAPSAKAFDWAWRAFARGVMPAQLEVWHESFCGRCRRKLTVPSSVSRGFGPECTDKMGL